MTQADEERAQADELSQGSVVAVLLQQHATIRDLFADVKAADGRRKKQLFDELLRLLAVHEMGEEVVVRPVTREVAGAGDDVAEARDQEEAEAGQAIAELERMDVTSPEFDVAFAAFERAVSEHAVSEEQLEFSKLVEERSPEVLEELGLALLAGQSAASAQQRIGDGGEGREPGEPGGSATFESLLAQARQAFED